MVYVSAELESAWRCLRWGETCCGVGFGEEERLDVARELRVVVPFQSGKLWRGILCGLGVGFISICPCADNSQSLGTRDGVFFGLWAGEMNYQYYQFFECKNSNSETGSEKGRCRWTIQTIGGAHRCLNELV